jgi:hypothetical protein
MKAAEVTIPKPEQLSVPDLLRIPDSEGAWIVEGLLRRGSQMLLAAPPKSGKSLLASEIALALSIPFRKGEERYLFGAEPKSDTTPAFPGLKICPSANGEGWRVLFLSLEMREPEISVRLRKQLIRFGLAPPRPPKKVPKKFNFPLIHVFGLPHPSAGGVKQDLQIVTIRPGTTGATGITEDGDDFRPLQELIRDVNPDVVIYDTLIQMHGLNENDNILMKDVMRALRRLTVVDGKSGAEGGRHVPVAHIVVHHTRKESNQFRSVLSPDSMRGAGAVHGVADLVMLARQDVRPETLEVHISSRSSSIPNFFLRRESATLTHVLESRKKDERISGPEMVRAVILHLLKDAKLTSKRLKHEAIERAVASVAKKSGKRLKDSKVTIQARFDELLDAGAVHIVKGYLVANADNEIRKGAKFKWDESWFQLGPQTKEPIRLPKQSQATADSVQKSVKIARKKNKNKPHTP